MNHTFLSFLVRHVPDYQDRHYLLAVSGGLDSISMLHLFLENNLNVSIVHCNFGLRGSESETDEKFVREISSNNYIECYTKKFDTKTYAKENGISIQMAARDLRYQWFNEICDQNAMDYICTAHHLNDSVETQLFNLIKGTGLRGLSGIQPLNGRLLRPLLNFSREQIESYASEKKLRWREDLSNASTDYHRNFIRLKLIPLMKEVNSNFPSGHGNTMERLYAANSILDIWLGENLNNWVTHADGVAHFPIIHLKKFTEEQGRLILSYWLGDKGYNYSQITDISNSYSAESGKIFLSEEYELTKDRTDFLLQKRREENSICIEIQNDDHFLDFNGHHISIGTIDRSAWKPDLNPGVIQLDKDTLQFPLQFRIWKEGDWFIPMGMKGKKKISDFMIDRKIPVNFKKKLRILESNHQIAAIVGYQIDERFKVTEKTKKVFIFNMQHAQSF